MLDRKPVRQKRQVSSFGVDRAIHGFMNLPPARALTRPFGSEASAAMLAASRPDVKSAPDVFADALVPGL
jgi:hypothetical protein